MDGTPHLLTDVQFSERRRGYDPEEVDNFLERVSGAVAQLQDKLREATTRAEEADGKIADAQRARSAAEAELARLGGDPAAAPAPISVDPELEAERASRVLLMAQKTADATIDDANVTAQQTIADARARAASLIADAEGEGEKLRGDAKREADELVEQQRATVVRDVKELEDVRASVQSDVETLNNHLDEQRSRIRRGVEALAMVLDDPDGLRVDVAPELQDASMTDVLPDVDAAADAEDDSGAEEDTEEPSDQDDVEDPSIVLLNDGIDVSGVDLTGAPQPARAPGGIFGAQDADTKARSASGAQMSAGSDDADEFAAVAPPGLSKNEAPDIDLASEELFVAVERDNRGGPPTQQFTPFAESEDPLGPADDEADKAMRAFFEADFETDSPEQKSRFGFRR